MSAVTPAAAPPAPVPGTVRRLRPGVAVTPLRGGLHLRGRRRNVTLEGSPALPALWDFLAGPLRAGGLEALLEDMEPGSAARRAVETVVAQLDAHDLLVTGPAGPAGSGAPGPADDWIEVTADDPARAAAALAATRAEVVSGVPGTALARAVGRALAAAGLPVAHTTDPTLPEGRVHLYADTAAPGPVRAAGAVGGRAAGGRRGGVGAAPGSGARIGVAVGWCRAGGYATAPGSPAQVRAEAAALETRLGPPGATGDTGRPAALLPLLAGAAAHRLLCAAAGLADPSAEGEDDRLLPGLPAVLLAEAGPLWADYRTWVGPGRLDSGRRAELAPAGTLGDAVRRVAALVDGRCGALPEPLRADLRQVPVPLATCVLRAAGQPERFLLGAAVRLDLARLDLFCGAAELMLDGPGFTVGANPEHARGRALRAAALRGPAAGSRPVDSDAWAGHPQVRHWWATLTGRLAVPARLEVHRVAPDVEAYRAVVRSAPAGGGAPGVVLGDAVEATPADAAAFAALTAVARAHAAAAAPGAAGRPAVLARCSGGAVAPLAAAGVRTAAWEDRGWTGTWLAELAGREGAFQEALHRYTAPPLPAGAPPTRQRPRPRTAPEGELTSLLRAFGFSVLHGHREAR
ncbi:hypothetical protein [Streptomyces subrutilus]|uniref:hypothetical protein n=1 Tax=Streptomyces subrutilus TaxID=36818 RepID=UPI002E0E07DB|nr:hypothetical protein OG479_02765 [Streptomyces subrutilus]